MRSSTIVPGSFSKPKFGYRYKVPKPKFVVEKIEKEIVYHDVLLIPKWLVWGILGIVLGACCWVGFEFWLENSSIEKIITTPTTP